MSDHDTAASRSGWVTPSFEGANVGRQQTESFWAGPKGDAYACRSPGNVVAVTHMLGTVLQRMEEPETIIELGAGVGTNLRALHMLLPRAELAALEINPAAAVQQPGYVEQFEGSLLDFQPNRSWDLALTRGVLIHVHPTNLRQAYHALWRASRRYILVAEYYSPHLEEIDYRGEGGRLWKGDYAGDMLDLFGDLRLVDTGWVYHRGTFPQDDITWFLLEKRS